MAQGPRKHRGAFWGIQNPKRKENKLVKQTFGRRATAAKSAHLSKRGTKGGILVGGSKSTTR